MKIPFQLRRLSERHARLTWTGTPGVYVSIFSSGSRIVGPVRDPSAAKSYDVATPAAGALEVHECLGGFEPVVPTDPPVAFRPRIAWPAVPGASEYRVTVDGVVVAIVPANGAQSWQAIIPSVDLRVDGGGWRLVSVLATVGTSSVVARASYYLRAEGPPAEPTSIELDGTVPDITVYVI